MHAASVPFAEGQEFVMSRLRPPAIVSILITIFSANGCSLCCSPYTDDYVTFGSRTPRLDMKNGRVGSILSDNQALNGIPAFSSDTSHEPSEYLEFPDETSKTVLQDEAAVYLGSPLE